MGIFKYYDDCFIMAYWLYLSLFIVGKIVLECKFKNVVISFDLGEDSSVKIILMEFK